MGASAEAMTRNKQTPIMEVDVAKVTRLDADLLIPGKGDPIKTASLVWKDSKIVYAGESKKLPQEYGEMQAAKVPVVMPGMWDCHGISSLQLKIIYACADGYCSTLHRLK